MLIPFQISNIESERDQVIDRMKECQQQEMEKIETYCTDVLSKRDQLQDTVSRARAFKVSSHVTEKMAEKERITYELNSKMHVGLRKYEKRALPCLVIKGMFEWFLAYQSPMGHNKH